METGMRVLCGMLSVVLVLFAAVQYNDPDALLWAGLYGIGALWCGFAAFSPDTLAWRPARLMLLATLALMAWGLVAFWPDAERWWSIGVWWPEITGESSREGMGMMILFAAVLAAAAVALRRA
jgi:hypothetical protein